MSSSILTTAQRGELRAALLDELVAAHTLAFPVEVLLRRLQRHRLVDFEATVAEATAEISALHARGLVAVVPDPITGATHYQVTPAGVVAHGNR